ncbi:unnamed protein product [Effrenium voratum]|nr:unnamed protein product [Effrenium voratum]
MRVLQALEGIQWAAERGDGVVALKFWQTCQQMLRSELAQDAPGADARRVVERSRQASKEKARSSSVPRIVVETCEESSASAAPRQEGPSPLLVPAAPSPSRGSMVSLAESSLDGESKPRRSIRRKVQEEDPLTLRLKQMDNENVWSDYRPCRPLCCEAIDPALLRPGRFDRFIQVELPDEEERKQILKVHVRKADANMEVAASTLQRIAAESAGFSGAELANVVNEAVFLALRESRARPSPQDFERALERRQLARKAAAASLAGDAGLGGFRTRGFWKTAAV